MSRTDVIVIGAGHNGLVAAAYLARAGKSVVVVEAAEHAGGTCATEQIAPGFRAPVVFGSVERLHRSIVADLGLDRHGLQLLEGGSTVLLERGTVPMTVPAGGMPADLSSNDAAGLQRLLGFLGRVTRALEPVFAEPLPDIDRRGAGDVIELLGLAWRLRKLGRQEMPAAMRLLPMALRDVAEEYVSDERLKAALAWPGLRASTHGPYAPGGAFSLLYHCPPWHGGPFAAPVYAAGGPGGLTEALAAAAAAAGVKIRTGSRVERITVDEGGVSGVVLEGGEEVAARRVLSALDPRTTLTRLLQPGWLDPDVLAAVGNVRAHGSVSIVTLALETLPRFKGLDGGDRALSGRIQLGPTLRYQEEAADAVKYGRLPAHPVLEMTIPSTVDGTLAPAGKHVMHAWVQYTPRHLRESSWESERDTLGKLVLDAIEGYAPGFATSVQEMKVTTPADIESRYGIADGHPYHVDTTLDQVLYMRPLPGWYDYRTPVAGLYLGGPGCHPGGGITGLPGKLASRQVLHDWKAQRIA